MATPRTSVVGASQSSFNSPATVSRSTPRTTLSKLTPLPRAQRRARRVQTSSRSGSQNGSSARREDQSRRQEVPRSRSNGGSSSNQSEVKVQEALPFEDRTLRSTVCLYWDSGDKRLGVSVYEPATRKLMVGESSSLGAVEHMLSLNPQVIITNANQGSEVYQTLQVNQQEDQDGLGRGFEVNRLKASMFSFKTAQNVITSHLKVGFDNLHHQVNANESKADEAKLPAELEEVQQRNVSVLSLVNYEERAATVALGTLIQYLLRNPALHDGGGLRKYSPSVLSVDKVDVLNLDQCVMLDRMTAKALHIFADERLLNDTRKKEGLSLFGVLNRCKTSDGAAVLKSMLQFPSSSKVVIESRLQRVKAFIQAPSAEVEEIAKAVSGMRDAHRVLSRFQNSKETHKEWLLLMQVLDNCCALNDISLRVTGDIGQTLFPYQALWTTRMATLSKMLAGTLDKSETEKNLEPTILRGISPKLDQLFQVLNTLPVLMERLTKEDKELGVFPSSFSEFGYIYSQCTGFFLEVTSSSLSVQEARRLRTPDLKYQYEKDGALYFQTKRTQELEKSIGDVQTEFSQEQRVLMSELRTEVMKVLSDIEKFALSMYEMDAHMSLADAALEFEMVCPQIVEDPVIDIKEGIHILQALCTDPFIRNSCAMSKGPNNSGKSVYMKQIGLIMYMAHCGSFVPASSAKVGVADYILTKITTSTSVLSELSSFADDSSQVAYALRHATPRSLILIDEYGKGTEAEDGIALLTAVCWHFSALGCRTLVTSHLHEVISRNLLSHLGTVSFKTLDVLREDDISKITLLYRLVDGVATSSDSVHIGRVAGIPGGVLDRVSSLVNAFKKRERITPLESLPSMASFSQDNLELVKRFTELDLSTDDSIQEFIAFLKAM